MAHLGFGSGVVEVCDFVKLLRIRSRASRIRLADFGILLHLLDGRLRARIERLGGWWTWLVRCCVQWQVGRPSDHGAGRKDGEIP